MQEVNDSVFFILNHSYYIESENKISIRGLI